MSWFEEITGTDEHSFILNYCNQRNKGIDPISKEIINIKTGQHFKTSTLLIITLNELLSITNHSISLSTNIKTEKIPKIKLLFGENADVKILQRKMKSAVFLVASNFDGLEHKRENTNLLTPNFITSYSKDHTQGPSAALCSPAAAIYRSCYCGYSAISKDSDSFKNSLENLNDIYHVENGYANLTKLNGDLMKLNDAGLYKVIIHENLDILSTDFKEIVSSNKIDQVYGAAINIKQREIGKINKNICDKYPQILYYPLYCAYLATYLTSIKNNRKNIVLTLLGGGVFGNPLNMIMDAIINVHKQLSNYLNSVENVYLSLFKCSAKDKKYIMDRLTEL